MVRRLIAVTLVMWFVGCGSSSGPVQTSDVKDVTDASGKDGILDSAGEVATECSNDEQCIALLGDIGPCRIAVCDPQTGMCEARPTKDGTPCNDDAPCTGEGECSAGECVVGPNTCDCTTDAECAQFDDDNLCNGTLVCEEGVCEVDDTTVKNCGSPVNGACVVPECVPQTGECVDEPLEDGSECDDEDPCTDGDTCEAGVCLPGPFICAEVCGNTLCLGEETCLTCPQDCGVCPPKCGDELCNGTETCADCPADCGKCGPKCPDTVCAGSETCLTCPADCGDCSPTCGNMTCTLDESCRNCPADCGACPETCGDEVCQEQESCAECPYDCGACPVCGNQTCEDSETCALCPADCGTCEGCQDGFCNPNLEDCLLCPEDCGVCPGDCCTVHASPFCSEAFLRDCVCFELPECCSESWDAHCVLAVETLNCGKCPDACGDGVCTGDEDCANCTADCGVCPTSCCWPQPGAGCDDALVTEFVCLQEPSCCQQQWTEQCVQLLRQGWPAFCCGDGTCQPDEECQTCPMDCQCEGFCGDGVCAGGDEDASTCPSDCPMLAADCCKAHGTPGCQNVEVETLVCAKWPLCCSDAWYPQCVDILLVEAPEVCCGNGECGATENCTTCTDDCGLCEDACCTAHKQSGCNDPIVELLVCQTRPECCSYSWDEECAGFARNIAPLVCCGDQKCNGAENCDNCRIDCGYCPPPCGDQLCDVGKGEHCAMCPADCGECETGCCQVGGPLGCGDAETWYMVTSMMPQCAWEWTAECVEFWNSFVPDGCCGNGQCSMAESCVNCPQDCGECVPKCGDMLCNGDETCQNCAVDCGQCNTCCYEHPGYGCDDPGVMMCVCNIEPGCCQGYWSYSCVELAAKSGCYACPDVCGNGICEWYESCGTCPGDCGECQTDCCLPSTQPGCADPVAEKAVCDVIPECCSIAWAPFCAIVLEQIYYGYCCGDGLCSMVETGQSCSDCIYKSDCCEQHFSTGCSDDQVTDCVCSLDEECCKFGWTKKCVALAMENGCADCLPSCGDTVCSEGESCDSCPADCGACANDCCRTSGTLGCVDSTVRAAVCAADPNCCGLGWSVNCALSTAGLFPEKCCGNGDCDVTETCDTCPADCGLCEGSCCAVGGLGCDDGLVETAICSMDPYCCDMKWDDLCVAEVGRDFPQYCCGDNVCGGGDDCSTCSEDCGECVGNCCSPKAGPGCGDAFIQTCVCTYMPECCTMKWVPECIELGFDAGCLQCVPVCGDSVCLPGEDCLNCPADCGACHTECCQAQDRTGCDDPDLSTAVCDELPFCCAVAWTDACAQAVEQVRKGYCCGDSVCSAGESCLSCPGDCGECPVVCGQHGCQEGETCESCPDDCGSCNQTECAALVNCLNGCTENMCADACFSQASPEAMQKYNDIVVCILGFCQNPTDACVEWALSGMCKPVYDACIACVADCAGRECGPDGCGGSCGQCEGSDTCNPMGMCEAPGLCGDGICNPLNENCKYCSKDCGVCPVDCCQEQAGGGCIDPGLAYEVCQTLPDCCLVAWGQQCVAKLKELHPDSCCGNGWCSEDEQCVCEVDCGPCPPQYSCGEALDCAISCAGNPVCIDQCGAAIPAEARERFFPLVDCVSTLCPTLDMNCVFQAANQQCAPAYYYCLGCNTACGGRECGNNDCGGSCGTCAGNEFCNKFGACEEFACGDGKCDDFLGESCDTCPGDCGQCPPGECIDILLCAQTCPDLSCMMQCQSTGTPQAQAKWQALFNCVLSACSLNASEECFMLVIQGTCAAQYQGCISCLPECAGRTCGDDGCGGSCGQCDGAVPVCSSEGTCVAGWGCGDGACVWPESCTSCKADCGECLYHSCTEAAFPMANCGAQPACATGVLQTTVDWAIVPLQNLMDCLWMYCQPGDFPCFMQVSQGPCAGAMAQCDCVPYCGGRECGDDGCGGQCGTCPDGTVCSPLGGCGEGCGDGTCGSAESCKTCSSDCGKCPNDCCLAQATPGCVNGSIMACECFAHNNLECCTQAWTAECVSSAIMNGCMYCE